MKKPFALVAVIGVLQLTPQDVRARDLTVQEIREIVEKKTCRFGLQTTYAFGPDGQLAKKNRKSDHYTVSKGRLCVVMWPFGKNCYRIERRPSGTLLATHRASSRYGGVMTCR